MQASACVYPLRFSEEKTMNSQSLTSAGLPPTTEETPMQVDRENRATAARRIASRKGSTSPCEAQVESRLEGKKEVQASACVSPLRFPEEKIMNNQSPHIVRTPAGRHRAAQYAPNEGEEQRSSGINPDR